MDFKKILLTFIGVFVVLDVFLAYSWFRMRQPVVTATTTTEIINEMRSEGINFGKVDDDVSYGAYLSGEESGTYLKDHQHELASRWKLSFSEDVMTATLDTPLTLGKTRKEILAALKKMLRQPDQIMQGTQYAYDPDLTSFGNHLDTYENDLVVFTEVASKNRRFYSSHAQIRFMFNHSRQLVGYTQSYVNNATILRDETQLISEQQALTTLYQYNELPNNSEVLWRKLEYAQLITVDGDTIYVPAWFFNVKNSSGEESIHKINAFNGTLMK